MPTTTKKEPRVPGMKDLVYFVIPIGIALISLGLFLQFKFSVGG
jgi:hypothetical protein